MLIADHRAIIRTEGATAVTFGDAAQPVDAWVRDRGVCTLPAEAASRSDEAGRYALVRVEAALLSAQPERGSIVSMLDAEWQVRLVRPSGQAGAPAIYIVHCVTAEVSRGRGWG